MKIVLEPWAIMPTRAHEFDAGLDLYSAYDDVCIFPVRFAATSTEISFAKSVLKKLATLSASAFIESTILQFSIILFILLQAFLARQRPVLIRIQKPFVEIAPPRDAEFTAITVLHLCHHPLSVDD